MAVELIDGILTLLKTSKGLVEDVKLVGGACRAVCGTEGWTRLG